MALWWRIYLPAGFLGAVECTEEELRAELRGFCFNIEGNAVILIAPR